MMPGSPGKSSCQFFIIYFSLTFYIVDLFIIFFLF